MKMKKITKTQRELAKEAMTMVDQWPLEKVGELCVEEVSRRLIVNRSTLSRAFRAYYYPTLERCIIRKKCASFSIFVMYDKIDTVEEGLKILGINSRNNFTRQFKRYCHCTPGKYLRKQKRIIEEIRKKYQPK
jgi:AraC-like DNA-binding protein